MTILELLKTSNYEQKMPLTIDKYFYSKNGYMIILYVFFIYLFSNQAIDRNQQKMFLKINFSQKQIFQSKVDGKMSKNQRKSIIGLLSDSEQQIQKRPVIWQQKRENGVDELMSQNQDQILSQTSKKDKKKKKKIQKKQENILDSIKNEYQRQRVQKSLKEKIYLISASRQDQQQWRFVVQGSQNVRYVVELDVMMDCTCVDLSRNFKPCKHIYFIITQVAKDSIDKYQHDSLIIAEETMLQLDQLLLNRLARRYSDKPEQKIPPEQIDLKQDSDCSFCFIQMDKKEQHLQKCNTCTKYFHSECLTAWKKQKNNYPLCRTSLNQQIIREKGPLERLAFFQLNAAQ